MKNLVNGLSAQWNDAVTSKHAVNIDIPAISFKNFGALTNQRDKDFQDRGGLVLTFNTATHDFAHQFERAQIKDQRDLGRPSLPYLVSEYAHRLYLPTDTPEFKALMLCAFRAEMDEYVSSRPAYHNTQHYADVVSIMANFILISRNRGTHFFNAKEETLGLLAAVIHDINHPGRSNPKDHKTKNEENSFNAVRGLMCYCGMDGNDMQIVKSMLCGTSPDGPHQVIKHAIARQNNEIVEYSDTISSSDHQVLMPILPNPNKLQMAAMLCDADIFAGTATDIKTQKFMSSLLTDEVRNTGADVDFTTPQSRIGFFNHMLGERGFTSDVGQFVGNDNYFDLRKQTLDQLKTL